MCLRVCLVQCVGAAGVAGAVASGWRGAWHWKRGLGRAGARVVRTAAEAGPGNSAWQGMRETWGTVWPPLVVGALGAVGTGVVWLVRNVATHKDIDSMRLDVRKDIDSIRIDIRERFGEVRSDGKMAKELALALAVVGMTVVYMKRQGR